MDMKRQMLICHIHVVGEKEKKKWENYKDANNY
jgi:hypothetical protein